jgi:3-oxoadipate enol-lactonase
MRGQHGYVDVGGTSLYYEVAGAGDPIVLLHGLSFDLSLWDEQVAALAERYRMVRYDLRGFGKSAPASVPYSHAADLEAVLAHIGIPRAVIVGLSMGGGAAINFALAHPTAVRGLVLVDATLAGFAWSDEFRADRAAVHAAARGSGLDAARRRWLAMPMFQPTLANAAAARRLRALVDVYSGWHWTHPDPGLPTHPPAIERLHEIETPTLVVVGERDTLDFHGIAATLAARICDAKKLVVAGAGHLPNLEAPERFNEALLQFLSELPEE